MDKHNCLKEDYVYSDIGFYVCRICGTVIKNEPNQEEEFKPNVSFVVKTYIPYNKKYKNLFRLHSWSNYDYYEVRNNNLQKMISHYPLNKNVLQKANFIFFREFKKVKTRGNVKMGLVCYSIYKAHLDLKINVDLDYWIRYLGIKVKHYNNAVKKLNQDWLYYPRGINVYLSKIDNIIDKNEMILEYNKFINNNNNSFNTKTILSTLIYKILKDDGLIDDYNFFKLFKISKASILNVKRLL